MLNPIGLDPFGSKTDALGGGRLTLPLDFPVLVVFQSFLKFFLKEHLDIGKNAKKQPHILKNKQKL